ncbi:MAG: reverse transcriptase/maturase family protein, partial [Rhodospirillaceae bacterium]
MAKKYRNLFPNIITDANLRQAYELTARGKHETMGYLQFKEFAEPSLADLRNELASETYRTGEYRCFMVTDPKPRQIMALSFRDRIAQHALVNVIGPIFERMFLPVSYACRDGRGTHAGVRHLQAMMRHLGRDGPVHCLKMDFSKYFASIDRNILNGMIRRKISCSMTMRLIEVITPPDGRGLPIGSLTSQLYANLYADAFDRTLIHDMGQAHFVRYMDDTVVLSHSQAMLREVKSWAEWFAHDRLHLSFSRWSIAPVSRGVNFLGYRIWPTHKLLRRQSVARAKRKIAAYVARGETEKLTRFLASWHGHASWAMPTTSFNSWRNVLSIVIN